MEQEGKETRREREKQTRREKESSRAIRELGGREGNLNKTLPLSLSFQLPRFPSLLFHELQSVSMQSRFLYSPSIQLIPHAGWLSGSQSCAPLTREQHLLEQLTP